MGRSSTESPIETNEVFLEYDPVSKRKVLNTYEILRDLGHGQHGKVKLARDTLSNVLVAIKIVDRKSKPKLGRSNPPEDKIKREIAIMKKCNHPHVVRLIEVLDDLKSRKIYLVLEYLEKGEIGWQKDIGGLLKPVHSYFRVKKIFRDVVLGLEYLHYQGIIHRDIKPANLLVAADDTVKISDFGVSFATSSAEIDNEVALAKTDGTPAFFAPELCQMSSKVSHMIDLWALGVTLYCLLFGQLAFNGDNEFALFENILTKPVNIPTKSALLDGDRVTDLEFSACVNLLDKLLTKDPEQRIDIPELKKHRFFLTGLSHSDSKKYTSRCHADMKIKVSNEEVDDAVIGVGNKIKKRLARALKFSGRAGSESGRNSSSSIESSKSKTVILSESVDRRPRAEPTYIDLPPSRGCIRKSNSIAASLISGARANSLSSVDRHNASGVFNLQNEASSAQLERILHERSQPELKTKFTDSNVSFGNVSYGERPINPRNGSSTIILPVSESFASLNSIEDADFGVGDKLAPEAAEGTKLLKKIREEDQIDSQSFSSYSTSSSVENPLPAAPGAMRPRFLSTNDSDSEDEDELTLVLGPKRNSIKMPPILRSRVMNHERSLPMMHDNASDTMLARMASSVSLEVPAAMQGLIPELSDANLKSRSEMTYNPTRQKSTAVTEKLKQVKYNPHLFKNHFHKNHYVVPFASKSRHYNGEKREEKEEINGERPKMTRSNTVAIGLLQRGNV